MNNKGFIATSLVYAFFLVFVAVIATVLATYTHNRILISNVNTGIEEDLNHSIENKYLVIENILTNSNFEEDEGWDLTNATNLNPSFSAYLGLRSIALNKGDSTISQTVKELQANHYYYLRFYLFRNGPITGNSAITLKSNTNPSTVINYGLNLISDDVSVNWEAMSNIMRLNLDGDYDLQIVGTNIDGVFNNLNIDALMLIDVTALIDDGNSIPDSKTFIDTLDYFEGQKSIMKP